MSIINDIYYFVDFMYYIVNQEFNNNAKLDIIKYNSINKNININVINTFVNSNKYKLIKYYNIKNKDIIIKINNYCNYMIKYIKPYINQYIKPYINQYIKQFINYLSNISHSS